MWSQWCFQFRTLHDVETLTGFKTKISPCMLFYVCAWPLKSPDGHVELETLIWISWPWISTIDIKLDKPTKANLIGLKEHSIDANFLPRIEKQMELSVKHLSTRNGWLWECPLWPSYKSWVLRQQGGKHLEVKSWNYPRNIFRLTTSKGTWCFLKIRWKGQHLLSHSSDVWFPTQPAKSGI